MPKNDNPHALRLGEAIRSVHENETADAIAQSLPLSKSADVSKKHQWACDICAALESQYGAEDAAKIRRTCRCGDGTTMAKEISACISKTGNLAAGCALFSQKNKYAFLEYIDEHSLIFGYASAAASSVQRAMFPGSGASAPPDTPKPCSVRSLAAMYASSCCAPLNPEANAAPFLSNGDQTRESMEFSAAFAGFLLTNRTFYIIV